MWDREFDELKIIFTPSQHSSSRVDGKNRTLWISFVMEFKNADKRVFFSSDGGYFTHFKKIGDYYFKEFDLVCLESGQFNKVWSFSHSFSGANSKRSTGFKRKSFNAYTLG